MGLFNKIKKSHKNLVKQPGERIITGLAFENVTLIQLA